MTDFAIRVMAVGTTVVMIGLVVLLVVVLTEMHRAERRRATLPPDSAQLRELAASLERLSRRVADLASRSESAEKEHAGVT